MQLPDGTTLMHGDAPYDPSKAHEYYLRTRKLKGRKKGVAQPPTGGQRHHGNNTFTVTTKQGLTVKLSGKQLAEQRTYAAQRVQRITAKLHTLESELSKKMAEARKKTQDAKRPETAADKSKKAKESKQYADKHKTELANKAKKAASEKKDTPKKADTDTVEGLKRTIDKVKTNLKGAVERQRALMTATKN